MRETISFDCESVEISNSKWNVLQLNVTEPNFSELIDEIGIDKILNHFDKHKILDEIGENECKDYFGLIEE
jgi:hypothetical protein